MRVAGLDRARAVFPARGHDAVALLLLFLSARGLIR